MHKTRQSIRLCRKHRNLRRAFGDNKPSGILKTTTTPNNAVTQDATTTALLRATTPTLKFNLRYPGQYFDEESNLNYNYQRSYQFGQGRYSQSDPIGLDGGWNRFGYVGGNALSLVDPEGLRSSVGGFLRDVTGLSGRPDSVVQAARRYEKDKQKKKNGYDTLTGYPIPNLPQPVCVTVCSNDGDICRPIPANAIPQLGRSGCHLVCTAHGIQ